MIQFQTLMVETDKDYHIGDTLYVDEFEADTREQIEITYSNFVAYLKETQAQRVARGEILVWSCFIEIATDGNATL